MTRKVITVCPHCGEKADDLIDSEGQENAASGDLLFCPECGQFNIFTSGRRGRLRKPTEREMAEIAKDHRCTVLMVQWAKWNATSRAVN